MGLVRACIGTKFSSRYGDLIVRMAVDAVKAVTIEVRSRLCAGVPLRSCAPLPLSALQLGGGKKEIDIKRYAKVEKLPGGELEDCHVMRGVMVEKDVTHPRMRRVIRNPRVILLDCTLEYKKAESATQLEITREEDFEAILKQVRCRRAGRGPARLPAVVPSCAGRTLSAEPQTIL